jgi:Zn-dependent protease with chaperone function
MPVAAPVPEPDDLIKLLDGDLKAGRQSPLYTLGALVVAIVMVILPVIYLALIAAVGYLTYLHAVENVGILNGGGMRGRLMAYLGPLFAGLVVCFFLIKPLFARPVSGPEPVSLDRENEPLLFAWVERLCGMVGAPLPKRIDVDCNVNASASFQGGLWGMIRRNMVLTIGLPLVGGMTLTQFSGILAHEFGHFAQGGAMRLSYIIRSVNFWFARVVYERDSFDEGLNELQSSGSIGIMLVALVAKGGVWLSRRVLWCLMMVGHLFSTFLLRQMEYDADRYETQLAGSPAFQDTVARLHRLMVGHNQAMGQVNDFWRERKLPDDLPAVCFANTDSLDDEAMDTYLTQVFKQKTDRWSTHPSDRDRIRHAEKMEAPGVLHSELPADILLSGIDEVSRKVTESFYRFQMGGSPDEKYLWSTRELMESQKLEADRNRGIQRFLQGGIERGALFFPEAKGEILPEDRADVVGELKDLRSKLMAARDEGAEVRNELANRRLELGLHLLEFPQIEDALGDIERSTAKTGNLASVMNCLSRVFPLSEELDRIFKTALRELEALQKDQESKVKRYAFDESVRDLQTCYLKIRDQLELVPYPFSHAEGEISCADYAAKAKAEIEELGPLFNSVSGLLEHLGPLYVKTLARLVEIAEMAEEAAGLERMEAPPAKSEDKEAEEGQA